MPGRPGQQELPLDVRRRAGRPTTSAVVVEAVLDALPSPTLLIDADGKVLLANTAWETAADLIPDEGVRVGIDGDYFAMARRLDGDGGAPALVEQLRALSRGERTSVQADYAIPHPDGTRWYHLQASRVDQAGQVVVTHTDVTSRVHAEKASDWRARHDTLTDLPNRAHLHELIGTELQRPERGPVSVLFLDIDGFKDVNDSLGHEAGDDLLRQIAARLTGSTRAGDTVGRLGGDEFVVLCRDCDPGGAEVLADRFRRSIDRPFDLGGRMVRLGVSIGISTAPPPGTEQAPIRSTDLVRDADLAMYAAKAAGRNRVRLFTPDLRTAAQRRATVAAELREAVLDDQLVLHYQPILHLPTRAVTGVEALVRWQHPSRGLLAPADFLPAAGQHGMLTPIARWVLRAATRQTADWARAGLWLTTAVNVAASHFSTGTLVRDVRDALSEAGLPPEQLVVELTETSVTEDAERAADQFAALRLSGVEVAIDDFGSGYSSLSQLVALPAGLLKIDRSLVAVPGDRRSQADAAIAAVVALGRACGIRTLAEGVETADQLEMAAGLGCAFAQGFHIARPMPADEVAGWLAAHGQPRAAGR